MYSAHMDPAKWSEPTEFRQDRFLDENGKVTGKDRIIPFSLGRPTHGHFVIALMQTTSIMLELHVACNLCQNNRPI